MARRRRKRETRPTDQADYNACISWQRIFVATVMAERDLTLPITGFLLDSRAVVAGAPAQTAGWAHARLRAAWGFVRDDELWFAAVRALEARVGARKNPGPDSKADEGRALCDALRAAYPKAPPGFERCGRSATGGE